MPLVKPYRDTKRLVKVDYDTSDIIELVQNVLEDDRDDTEGLAKTIPVNRRGLRWLFNHVDNRITYNEDPQFNQWVQTPSYLYHKTREGDCKSYTVFISSVLYNMGVPHYIRYTAYGTKDFRHVYPVAILNGREIPMDVVWKVQEGGRFGKEKSFTKKKDFYVDGLYKLGTTKAAQQSAQSTISQLEAVLADIPDSIITDGVGDITKMTSGQLDRVIMKEQLEIFASQSTGKERQLYLRGLAAIRRGKVAGIGNLYQTRFGASLEQFLRNTAYDNALAFQPFTLAIPSKAVVNGFNPFKAIGKVFKKLFAKLVNWIYKGPARKMAPYFLFTFINKSTSSKEINRRKAEQQKTYDWIKKAGRFDDKKLRGLIFNQIKSDTGMTPQEILNKGAEKTIAALPAGLAAKFAPKVLKALGLVVEVIKKITGLFKKKKEEVAEAGEVTAANAPDLELLEELNEKPVEKQDSSGVLLAAGMAALGVYFA